MAAEYQPFIEASDQPEKSLTHSFFFSMSSTCTWYYFENSLESPPPWIWRDLAEKVEEQLPRRGGGAGEDKVGPVVALLPRAWKLGTSWTFISDIKKKESSTWDFIRFPANVNFCHFSIEYICIVLKLNFKSMEYPDITVCDEIFQIEDQDFIGRSSYFQTRCFYGFCT